MFWTIDSINSATDERNICSLPDCHTDGTHFGNTDDGYATRRHRTFSQYNAVSCWRICESGEE